MVALRHHCHPRGGREEEAPHVVVEPHQEAPVRGGWWGVEGGSEGVKSEGVKSGERSV